MRTRTDDLSNKIIRLDFILGGQELTYPKIAGQVEFGDSTFDWKYEWPTQVDLEQLDILTIKEDLQLSEIRFKQENGNKWLIGIQLAFQNGIKTPWFETQ